MDRVNIDYEKLNSMPQFFYQGFLDWLPNNEHLYAAFEREAFKIINSGRTHFGARAIIEEFRFNTRLRENGESPYKFRNVFVPYFQRVFVVMHPHLAGFWSYYKKDTAAFLEACGVDPITKRPHGVSSK